MNGNILIAILFGVFIAIVAIVAIYGMFYAGDVSGKNDYISPDNDYD